MSRQQLIHSIFAAGAIAVLAGLTLFAVVDRPDDVVVQTQVPGAAEDKSASVSSLIGGLETRLAENPDDAKGWLLLARSHDHLGNHAEAWNAYSRARDLGLPDEALELKLAANMVGGLAE